MKAAVFGLAGGLAAAISGVLKRPRSGWLLLVLGLCLARATAAAEVTLINASYDPTRQFYDAFNTAFAQHWRMQTGDVVTVHQSHGGSGRQARAVMDGMRADVVTLGQAPDIDALAARGLLDPQWRQRLPHNSAPYSSTIVFMVRAGNPKGIRDWDDLRRPDVRVITANPKTSAGGRWNYLAAWGQALRAPGGSPARARAYVQALFQRVPVLDSGTRGATMTFAERGMGDVLLVWENEALLALREFGADRIAIVTPGTSIAADPPVAVVDRVVDRRGTRAVAQAYLEFLYSEPGQELAAAYFYRPASRRVAARHRAQFPDLELFTLEQIATGWADVQALHFSDGGLFDQIMAQRGLRER